jgi:hypothetical protein
LAPDGKCFAVILYPNGTAEQQSPLRLTFVLNFLDELHKRVSTNDRFGLRFSLPSLKNRFSFRLFSPALRFHMLEDGHATRAHEAKLGALVCGRRGSSPHGRKDVIVLGKRRLVPASGISQRNAD